MTTPFKDRLTVAPSPEPDDTFQLPELPDDLRRVLRSAPKLALLSILEERPYSTRQLRQRVTGTITLAGLNMHLSELLAAGYVVQIEPDKLPDEGLRGAKPRGWALNTDPGWRTLADEILRLAPTPRDH